MEYSKQIFGKHLRDLSYQDIADFFQTDRTENDLLEFKSVSSNSKLDSAWEVILKGVCAFLNSSGGLIVWGAPKETSIPNAVTSKKEKHCKGPLTNIDPTLQKDTIVSKISSNLTPLAGGFKVEILTDGTGNRVCIIEIDRSNYAPHQTGHSYYMRLDGQSVHAPHHYIEALIKRVSYPNLEGYLKFNTPTWVGQSAHWGEHYIANIDIWIFNFSPMENEEQLFFSLTSNPIKPADRAITGWTNIRMDRNLDALVGTDVTSVLMNGHPYVKTVPFQIDAKEFHSKDSVNINFLLLFGGKKSPLKYSKYAGSLTRKSNGTLKWALENEAKNKSSSQFGESDNLSRSGQLNHFGFN
jgi:hypothetical protein